MKAWWPNSNGSITVVSCGHIDRARPAHIDGCGDIDALRIKDNGKGRGGNIIAILGQRLMKVLLLDNTKALA